MPYRLTRTETVPEGLRRIAREEINSTASRLDSHQGIPDDESIHEARKGIKKLRALVRLAGPRIGKSAAGDNASLRRISRSLSDFRDAAALIEAVDRLRRNPKDAAAREPLLAVRSALAARDAGKSPEHSRGILAAAALALRHMKQRVQAWKTGGDGFDAIEPGLKQSYRLGRKALAKVREDQSADSFHTLRKRVKDHWYQVRLLESAGAEMIRTTEKSLSRLQEVLGDSNDLEVLTARLSGGLPLADEHVKGSVARLIAHAQCELREEALVLAGEFYSRRPKEYVRDLRRVWRDWSEKPSVPRKQPASAAAKRRRSAA